MREIEHGISLAAFPHGRDLNEDEVRKGCDANLDVILERHIFFNVVRLDMCANHT